MVQECPPGTKNTGHKEVVMNHLNSFLIEGYVTKHTDLTVSPRGLAHFSFTVASLRSYKANNYSIEDTSFFPVDVFGALAEGEAKTIATGAFVRVVGLSLIHISQGIVR